MMGAKHLIDLGDFSQEKIKSIVELACKIKENPSAYMDVCHGKIMATLFYEPSTRTKMSFQTAMLRLGGQVIGFDNPQNTSVSKGETLKDTIQIISGYADVIVMRTPTEGSAKAAALNSLIPVINAGDGGHLHPTQTLTDLVTMYTEKGTLHNLTIGLCGDLKYGRTVHSLIKEMCKYNTKFVLISTKELTVPQYLKDMMNASGCGYEEINTLEDAISKLDVLYMTRIQRERFASLEEYERQKNVYVLDSAKMKKAKKDMIVLHPLPRVDEIEIDVDNDPRAAYFRQAVNGMYARMALILTTLTSDEESKPIVLNREYPSVKCSNPKCVTQTETYLPKTFSKSGDMLVCDYCDERVLI